MIRVHFHLFKLLNCSTSFRFSIEPLILFLSFHWFILFYDLSIPVLFDQKLFNWKKADYYFNEAIKHSTNKDINNNDINNDYNYNNDNL